MQLKLLQSLYRKHRAKQDLLKPNYCRLHKSERKVYVRFLDTKPFPDGKIYCNTMFQFITNIFIFYILSESQPVFCWLPSTYQTVKNPVLIINTLPICTVEQSAFYLVSIIAKCLFILHQQECSAVSRVTDTIYISPADSFPS